MKKMIKVPHTYAIIFIVILIAAIGTYVIPAGKYDKEEIGGKQYVVDGSYHSVEQNPVGFFELFTSIPAGMQAGSQIIFYIFLLGGAFGIIQTTGAIDAGINVVVSKLKTKDKFLIPLIMIIFSILGFTTGTSEENIIFVPIGIGIAIALGYDAVVGTAMITLGAASGFIGGMLNPFTVGVAQGIAEIPLFSGFLFRSCVYIFILGAAIFYVMRYAAKVKADPKASVLYGEKIDRTVRTDDNKIPEFTWNRKLVLVILFGGIGVNMYGVIKQDWFLNELAASFMIIGFLAGFVGKLGVNKTFAAFVEGMKLVAFGALIVGFARTILVVMDNGAIIDSVVYGLSHVISQLPPVFGVIGMYVAQTFTNFFIPSGSGQAATTMPIMVPLADILDMPRQLAVLAFQYGDAISNSIIPTSAALMGYLGIAGIPYDKWVKFVWKLILIWMVIALIGLIIAFYIGVQ